MIFDKVYVEISGKIKKFRHNAGLTQEALAEKAGITLDFMSKIEVNIRKPSLLTLMKIANALNVPLRDFF